MSRGKRTSSCTVLLLLSTTLVLSGATKNETQQNSSACALQCEVPSGKTEAKCTLTADPLKLNCSREVYSSILPNTTSLDLSDNMLTEIPTWLFPYCKHLIEVSLAKNNIKEIKPGTFRYLGILKILNLSFNNLREWKVNPDNELQSLTFIDLTGNEHWLPSKQLFQLENLTTVQGVTWTKQCQNCRLTRSASKRSDVNASSELHCKRYQYISTPSGWPWHKQIQYGEALDFINVGFWPTCLCDEVCYINQFQLPYYRGLYPVSLKGFYPLYLTGSLAILVNIAVVLLILFDKSLRRDPAVILICHIAVCDLFISMFSVAAVKHSYHRMRIDYLEQQSAGTTIHDFWSKYRRFLNIVGPLMLSIATAHICGSFFMVLEIFFKIVFAMRPDIRLRREGVLLLLILSWILAMIFAVLPVFGVGGMYYESLVPYDPAGIAKACIIFLVFIQFSSLLLYIPIFITAARSGSNVGVKREATIAKKITLLAVTNLVFYTLPGVISASREHSGRFQSISLTKAQWLDFFFNVLPLLCTSINSLLNPFLYALRHPKVKKEFDTVYIRCRTSLGELSVVITQHLHSISRTNTVVPGEENDIELDAEVQIPAEQQKT